MASIRTKIPLLSSLVSLEDGVFFVVDDTVDTLKIAAEDVRSYMQAQPEMVLYVDGSSGDDANDGSSGNPLATLVEAETRVPIIHGRTLISATNSPVGGFTMPSFRPRLGTEPIVVYNEDSSDVLSSTAAASGSSQTQIVTAGGLGTNTYRGRALEVLTGAAAGDIRFIRDHTDTTIVPAVAFSAAVSSGDTFRVREPTGELDVNTDDGPIVEGTAARAPNSRGEAFFGWTSTAGVALANWKLITENNATLKTRGVLYLWGCETDDGFDLHLPCAGDAGQVIAGFENTALESVDTPVALSLASGSQSWLGWGLSARSKSVAQYGGRFFGSVNCGRYIVFAGGQCVIRGGNISSGGTDANSFGGPNSGWRGSLASMIVDGNFFLLPNVRVAVTGKCSAEGPGAMLSMREVDLDGSAVDAIHALRLGAARVQGDVVITNCARGLVASKGGKVLFDTGLSITSTTVDTAIDTGAAPTQALGSYTDGSYISATDGSVIQRDDI